METCQSIALSAGSLRLLRCTNTLNITGKDTCMCVGVTCWHWLDMVICAYAYEHDAFV